MDPNTTKKTASESAAGGAGGIYCAGDFYDEIGEFSELFDHKAKLAEAARFAMAVGIHTNSRLRREEWGPRERRNIANFSQFQGSDDFETLFTVLGLSSDDTPLNMLISEYISGGMKWIRDHELKSYTNFSELKDAFPHLFASDGAGNDGDQ